MLAETLDVDSKKFGFIIVDGKGALYAKLEGNNKEILSKFGVDLPNKHGRGGQSSNRFANIRTEKRHNYLRKVAEVAVQCFIENDRVNVNGLILGGSADLKTELGESDLFDQRLKAKILKYVDISYGNEVGLNQAIDLARDCLNDLKYVQEKELLGEYLLETTKNFVFFN
jgi:peptide chain release factor subunit 1